MLSDAAVERQQRNTIQGKASRAMSMMTGALQNLSAINSLTIIVIQVIVFSILCTAYMAFSNRYITQGYVVNKLEAEREQLVIQNEMTNRLIEQSKSLSAIRDTAHEQMVYSHGHTYVEAHDTQVAIALPYDALQ